MPDEMPREPGLPPDPGLGRWPRWNGVFPSPYQLWCLAAWMVTPARSKRYGARLNAWRVATDREPFTEADITEIRLMLRGRWRPS
jgi:hypothetical protein